MDGEDAALALFIAATVLSGVAARAFVRRARSAAGRARTTKLVVGNLLVTAFLLCAAGLAGECWLRWFRDSTDSFGLLVSTDRWFERHYKGNSLGYRDDADPEVEDAPDGRRRVTFLGDSFTAGHGVAEVRDRFANRVRAARPQWRVDVFAQNGMNTGAELTLLSEGLPTGSDRAYPCDVVVLVYCLNDVADLMPANEEMNARLRAYAHRGVLAESSRLFDLLRLYWILAAEPQVRDYYAVVADAYVGPLWDEQRARLRRLRAAVDARGGRLVVVTFPFLHDLGPGYRFREAHRRLAEFWAEEGVPALDLLAAFDGRDARALTVGPLDAHPNEAAHALAADAILPFLDRLVGGR